MRTQAAEMKLLQTVRWLQLNKETKSILSTWNRISALFLGYFPS
jgi:hypothetical protein